MLTLITFIVVLGLLVFVHELGHFMVARRSGVKVEEFGFGFPPRAIGVYRDPATKGWRFVGRRTKESPATIYSFNWVPLGGFVRIKGEQGEQASDPDSFAAKGVGVRVAILSAGVSMNVLLAAFLISIGFVMGIPQPIGDGLPSGARVRDAQIQIVQVLSGLPAAASGVQVGDAILSVDGATVSSVEQLQTYLTSRVGQPVKFLLKAAAGEPYEKIVTPQPREGSDRAWIGVQLEHVGVVSYPWYLAAIHGVRVTGEWMVQIVRAFGELFTNLVVNRQVTIDLSGPVGIAALTGTVTRLGFIYVLQFTALLSLNLAIINFLPFPALDGGRVVFLIIEKLRGRAVSARLETAIHNIGFIVLLVLIALVTMRDLGRLFGGPAA